MGTVVIGGFLLGENGRVMKKHGLAFEEGKILDVRDNETLLKEHPEFELMDCTDQILSPGFINAHMHLYGVLSHGIKVPPDISDFRTFLEDFWWPMVEDRIDHRMITVTSRAMALELINSGVTAFCDVLEAPMAIPGALEAAASALEGIGIRAVLSFEASERAGLKRGLLALKENGNFIDRYSGHKLISGMNCIHTTFTCSDDFIRRAVAESRQNGAPLQMHLSESRYEPDKCVDNCGKLPVHLYEELGLFEVPVLAAQGVKLTESEQKILLKYKTDLVHVPLSNCEVGGGFSPVPEMLEKGLNVALGTDGYINNFFEVMRGAFLLHKANLENPEIMPAETVYKMATQNGASALGLEGQGILKTGAPADFITIKPNLPTPLNDDNLFVQLVLGCNPENVKNVYVAGNAVKKNGRLVDANLETEYESVRAEAGRLWRVQE